jgi:hypothetical protein
MIRLNSTSDLSLTASPSVHPREENVLSSAARQLFDEALSATSNGWPGSGPEVPELLDARWEASTAALRDWPIADCLDGLCRHLWHVAADFLAPMDFDEEVIASCGARNKTVQVMQWALQHASSTAVRGFWTRNAAQALWNLQLKFDISEAFSLSVEQLDVLIQVDYRFTELLADQKRIASELATAAFEEAMNSELDIATQMQPYLAASRSRLCSSTCLFHRYLREIANCYLMSGYLDDTFLDVRALSRACRVRCWNNDAQFPRGQR